MTMREHPRSWKTRILIGASYVASARTRASMSFIAQRHSRRQTIGNLRIGSFRQNAPAAIPTMNMGVLLDTDMNDDDAAVERVMELADRYGGVGRTVHRLPLEKAIRTELERARREVCGDDHCWVGSSQVGLSDPPTYWRTCKHCGKRQSGRPQEPMDWMDVAQAAQDETLRSVMTIGDGEAAQEGRA